MDREQKHHKVADVFHSVADSYDLMNDLMSGSVHRLWKESFVKDLAPGNCFVRGAPGEPVHEVDGDDIEVCFLDVAGGTGDIAFRICDDIVGVSDASPGQRAKVIVSDINSSMLGVGADRWRTRQQNRLELQPGGAAVELAVEFLEARCIRAGAYAHIHYCCHRLSWRRLAHSCGTVNRSGRATPVHACDGVLEVRVVKQHGLRCVLVFGFDSAEELPLPDASVDTYTISFGIRNVTNIDVALSEAFRVLKPGGRFLCLEFSKVTIPGLREFYDVYSDNVIPVGCRVCVGGVVVLHVASLRPLRQSDCRKLVDDVRTHANLLALVLARTGDWRNSHWRPRLVPILGRQHPKFSTSSGVCGHDSRSWVSRSAPRGHVRWHRVCPFRLQAAVGHR